MFASSEAVAGKSPEKLQQEVSELLQRHDDEQKIQEKRAEEDRRGFQMIMNTLRPFIDPHSKEILMLQMNTVEQPSPLPKLHELGLRFKES